MSAEVVMIVEDENARLLSRRLAVEMSRRQTTDAAADHDQVVTLARVFGLAGRVPECTVTQIVGRVEGSGMAATKSGERRWIVVRRLLASRLRLTAHSEQVPGHDGCARRHRNPIQKIA